MNRHIKLAYLFLGITLVIFLISAFSVYEEKNGTMSSISIANLNKIGCICLGASGFYIIRRITPADLKIGYLKYLMMLCGVLAIVLVLFQ
jgi:hypothetical protein